MIGCGVMAQRRRGPKRVPVAPQLARLTRAELEAGKSPRGGYTRVQLAAWGIEWPPATGWQQLLLGEDPSTAGRPEPTGFVMEARRESVCDWCGRPISFGELITQDAVGEWVHHACAQ